MTALIFGASGQDGYYLSRLCEAKGLTPVGVSRTGDGLAGDVADRAFVRTLIADLKPSHIFHLAANSTTRHDTLFENHATIATGTLNILEEVHAAKLPARVFIAGSAVQFANDGTPVSEATPFEALNAYAVARIQSVYAARYFRSLGVRTFVGYLFHHESPLRKPGHVSQRIAGAVREIRAGRDEHLTIGDLDVAKEWTFAGDTAAAILALVSQDAVTEAVIGSGKAHTIREYVELCFSMAGLDWRKHVRTTPGFVPEYRRLVSDPSRLLGLGWRPAVDLSALARLMVEQRLHP